MTDSTDDNSQTPAPKIGRRSFIKRTAKNAALLTTGAAFGYLGGFCHNKDTRPELTSDDQSAINDVYAETYRYLKEKNQEAKANKKPLLILAGDTHEGVSSGNALLMQYICISAAADLGIRVVAPELDNKRYQYLLSGIEGRELIDSPNFKSVIQYSRGKGFSVAPIDTYVEKAIRNGLLSEKANNATMDKYFDDRNKEMIENLKELGSQHRGVVAIVGDCHMKALTQSKLQEVFVVVPISACETDKTLKNLSNLGILPHLPLKLSENNTDGIQWAYNDPSVHKLQLNMVLPNSRMGRGAKMVDEAANVFKKENIGQIR